MGTFADLKSKDVEAASRVCGAGMVVIHTFCVILDTDDAILAGFYAKADALAVDIKPESARHSWNLDRAKRDKERYLLKEGADNA